MTSLTFRLQSCLCPFRPKSPPAHCALRPLLYDIAHVAFTLRWRHNDYDSVSNHQPRGCLFNRLFRRRSKKTPKLRVTGLCVGNSPGPVNSPHKWPVTRKMFPFDDVIMSGIKYKVNHYVFTTVLYDKSYQNCKIHSWWVWGRGWTFTNIKCMTLKVILPCCDIRNLLAKSVCFAYDFQ